MAEIDWWLAGFDREPGPAMWSRPQSAKVARGHRQVGFGALTIDGAVPTVTPINVRAG